MISQQQLLDEALRTLGEYVAINRILNRDKEALEQKLAGHELIEQLSGDVAQDRLPAEEPT